MIDHILIDCFEIPEAGYGVTDLMLREDEQRFLLQLAPQREYAREELCRIAVAGGLKENRAEAESFVDEMFHRGVLNRGEDGSSYRTGTFYGRLDIFATEETESYDSLPRETKERLDRWYFDAYLESLGSMGNPYPTEDEVLPLDEVLEFIENRDDTPYLAKCDCRRLIQNCGQSTDTCITYRTAPNSFVKRRQAKPITKEEAKEIVREADRKGLIHTVNSGGICSCCTDCCYLFRAARARGSQGIWPRVHYVVKLDKDKCINCGACLKRCRFSVFSDKRKVRRGMAKTEQENCREMAETEKENCRETVETEQKNHRGAVEIEQINRCQGCGLCVTGCPTAALSLEKRN